MRPYGVFFLALLFHVLYGLPITGNAEVFADHRYAWDLLALFQHCRNGTQGLDIVCSLARHDVAQFHALRCHWSSQFVWLLHSVNRLSRHNRATKREPRKVLKLNRKGQTFSPAANIFLYILWLSALFETSLQHYKQASVYYQHHNI